MTRAALCDAWQIAYHHYHHFSTIVRHFQNDTSTQGTADHRQHLRTVWRGLLEASLVILRTEQSADDLRCRSVSIFGR